MSPLIGNVDDDPSSQCPHEGSRAHIETLLSTLAPVNWNAVNGLLWSLKDNDDTVHAEARYTSPQDDPMGRLFLARVISRNPPPHLLDSALRVFPDSLTHNPAAFFTASRDATPELIVQMMKHVCTRTDGKKDECPYPWIVSEHISVEAARAILKAYPKGVWKESPCLSSYNLVDFFLIAPTMVEQRRFDSTLWSKFKQILVAAECSRATRCPGGCIMSPVQVILRRVLSRSDIWDSPERAQHVLWLLHQLRWTDLWVFGKKSTCGRYPIHYVLSHKCTTDASGLIAARELVKLLIEAHPKSAAQWVNGKLALHMAIENGWPCHDLLLAAYPEALNAPDPRTELFPFQSAAKHPIVTSPSFSLDVTYELLRANPIHARGLGLL